MVVFFVGLRVLFWVRIWAGSVFVSVDWRFVLRLGCGGVQSRAGFRTDLGHFIARCRIGCGRIQTREVLRCRNDRVRSSSRVMR